MCACIEGLMLWRDYGYIKERRLFGMTLVDVPLEVFVPECSGTGFDNLTMARDESVEIPSTYSCCITSQGSSISLRGKGWRTLYLLRRNTIAYACPPDYQALARLKITWSQVQMLDFPQSLCIVRKLAS